jgi:hypothetical protein
MKEKLIIKNFGPIKHVELDLGKFNVLIGEQATGKSTVAKVLAVCRYFSYIALDEGFYAGYSNFSVGLESWGLSEFVKKDSKIFYECKHYSVTVEQRAIPIRDNLPGENGKYEIQEVTTFLPALKPISEEFINLLSELTKILSAPKEGFSFDPLDRKIPASFFLIDVANVMDNPFYLTTERGLQSIFSLGKESIGNMSDSLFNSFAKMDGIARSFKSDTIIEPLGIVYKNVNGRGYVKSKSHDFLSLFNGASGYQSTIPVVLLIKYYAEIKRERKTFIIEEPELNLFPNAQQKLIQYLVDKTMNFGNKILINTHSPYILTSLNNLLYAYKTGEGNPEETSKIIQKKYWLNPNEVSAYLMLPDGTCEDIFNREESLIAADRIDEVSALINKEFSDLINIEMEINEET